MLTTEAVPFLRYCKKIGVDFESTLQVGRNTVLFSSEEMGVKEGDYADPIYRFLGAKKVDSLDYSDYEQASIVHDMNLPIDGSFRESFSAVIEGGTLEHVFNYPIAIRNCMDMVKLGGHLVLMTPANNFFGHGFYQFSPDLFFSLLSEQNGFAETQIFQQDDSLRWFKIRNPKDLKRLMSVCIAKNKPSCLCVISKKIKSTPEKLEVTQSFWTDFWESGQPTHIVAEKKNEMAKIFVKKFYRRIRKFLGKIKAVKLIREFRQKKLEEKLFYEVIKLYS